MGVLAQPVQPLAGVGLETLFEAVVAVAGGGGQAGAGPPEVGGLLGQQLTAVLGAQEGSSESNVMTYNT
nr:hypothetical protein [Kutzneria sp. 744]